MTRPLKLLADDLTGALDSAAAFGTLDAPLPVVWRADAVVGAGPLAVDSGTRESEGCAAAAVVRRIAPHLFADRDAIAFKKIDSLLRGFEAEEIGAVLAARPFRRCVVAPAFPGQRRATRGGRQGLLGRDHVFTPLECDLAARLEALGHPVLLRRPGENCGEGIALFDAESDADLDRIVAAFDADDVLWVGSAGLAAALARRYAPTPHPRRQAAPLRAPLLGLFGTEHPVMRGQLDAVSDHGLRLASLDDLPQVTQRLARNGVAFVVADLPPSTEREAAAARIGLLFGGLVQTIEAPATLVVAGGETLRGLCGALGVDRLDVAGEILPGIPRSTLVGGRWSGTVCISKSGAFGAPDLLCNLLADLPAPALGAPVA